MKKGRQGKARVEAWAWPKERKERGKRRKRGWSKEGKREKKCRAGQAYKLS